MAVTGVGTMARGQGSSWAVVPVAAAAKKKKIIILHTCVPCNSL
jgi:hypothetical protein